MGCANSKYAAAEAVVADAYCLPPSSIALFDITKIDEPWLCANAPTVDSYDEKPPKQVPLPLPLLEKIESLELAPNSWSEVSKALEDLKPIIQQATPRPPLPQRPEPQPLVPPPSELAGFRSVKENSFVLRDRLERESKTKEEISRWRRRDPLEGYPDRQPPGNPSGIVLYTTTLRGVRRTFDDCERLRQVVEMQAVEAGVEVDERDVSLHGEFLKEVKELVGNGAAVPRLFVAGKYVGGASEVMELAEMGKLGEMMRWVGKKMGGDKGKGGRRDCEGCGGARFVPCTECSGSCKVVVDDGKSVVRCGVCNENGLVMCPLCH